LCGRKNEAIKVGMQNKAVIVRNPLADPKSHRGIGQCQKECKDYTSAVQGPFVPMCDLHSQNGEEKHEKEGY